MEDFDPKMIFVFPTFWILGKFDHDDFEVGFQSCTCSMLLVTPTYLVCVC